MALVGSVFIVHMRERSRESIDTVFDSTPISDDDLVYLAALHNDAAAEEALKPLYRGTFSRFAERS